MAIGYYSKFARTGGYASLSRMCECEDGDSLHPMVYAIIHYPSGYTKIGFTTRHINKRVQLLKPPVGFEDVGYHKYLPAWFISTQDYKDYESEIHKLFELFHMGGEWFDLPVDYMWSLQDYSIEAFPDVFSNITFYMQMVAAYEPKDWVVNRRFQDWKSK